MLPNNPNNNQPFQSHHHNLFSTYSLESNQLQDMTCWKTNLMLPEQQTRVQERNNLFRKRTSFENNLLQEHLASMVKIVTSTQLELLNSVLVNSDKPFQQLRQDKNLPEITQNQYLTQHQKWQFTNTILNNHENFSIFTRLSSLFLQNKSQLVYILSQILTFTSKINLHPKSNTSQQTIIQIMKDQEVQLVDRIVNQQVIKLVNPAFFSNSNEIPLMAIINGWFYHIIGIKQGLYGQEFQTETGHFEQEENLFDLDLEL